MESPLQKVRRAALDTSEGRCVPSGPSVSGLFERTPIAVVGIGLRIPGAESVRELWKLLCDRVDATREVPASRWDDRDFSRAPQDGPAPTAVGRRPPMRAGLIDGVHDADPTLLRLPRRELRHMDPQHRLLLECALHALEDAGMATDGARGSEGGVFVGLNFTDFQRMLARDWSALDGYALLGTTASFAANRISAAFDLRGPSSCTSVGCASSTIAIHEACRALALGEAEFAVAGGVELLLAPDASVMLGQAGVLSPGGRCRTLDARADGYVRGEGAAMVVLKPVTRLGPHDRVYAVIRASATNHNGRTEWITAPSRAAQEAVVRRCCAQVGVTGLDYVELHGSAFARGDAIEAEAIAAALAGPCRLGALSNNIGYLGAAGGVCQLIKVCLALHHRTLPPTIHVDEPSPHIDFAGLGLSVQRALEAWPQPAAGPRRAGVISTSLGGANAFVVVEEAALAPLEERPGPYLLLLSGHTRAALRGRVAQLLAFVADGADEAASLAAICFTAAHGRRHHRHRVAAIAGDREGLLGQLRRCEAALAGADAAPPGATPWADDDAPPMMLAQARAWLAGGAAPELAGEGLRWVGLPPHPCDRQRLWPEWLTPALISSDPARAREASDAARGEVAAQTADRRVELEGLELSGPAPRRGEEVGREQRLVALQKLDRGEREQRLIELLRVEVGEIVERAPDELDVRGRTLFEQGMTSLGLVELRGRIGAALGLELSTTTLFEFPRIAALAAHLADTSFDRTATGPAAEAAHDEPIAIIGMACRFPGADDPEGLAELLWAGRSAIGPVPAERAALLGGVGPRVGGFLTGVDLFDAEFFRITPREAEGVDPQQRLFLEVAWEALEHAGVAASELAGTRTGVFAGVHARDYAELHGGPADSVGPHWSTGVDASYVAGRLSYFLGLQGPSMAVDTACSSSLTALHLACQSLRAGESTLALAGGVKLLLAPRLSVFLERAGALAPGGACRAFDAGADGMVQGEGCGVVVLARLSDALRRGDRVLATIRASAVNHDGASGGLTVPSPRAQADLYRVAVERAGIDPGALDYLEAHGTGTRLGDPVELEGIARVYGAAGRARPLLIGSVKPNIGHAEAAAGVAGLIKAVLVLQRGEVPPSLGFTTPTPEFAWDRAAIAVAHERRGLPDARLVAVSSFGMSGVNAHAILERSCPPPVTAPAPAGPWTLVLTAHTEPALRALAARHADALADSDDAGLRDHCHTASVGRAPLACRVAIAGSTAGELSARLRAFAEGRATAGVTREGVELGRPLTGGRKARLPTYPWQRERHWWRHAPAPPPAPEPRADQRRLVHAITWAPEAARTGDGAFAGDGARDGAFAGDGARDGARDGVFAGDGARDGARDGVFAGEVALPGRWWIVDDERERAAALADLVVLAGGEPVDAPGPGLAGAIVFAGAGVDSIRARWADVAALLRASQGGPAPRLALVTRGAWAVTPGDPPPTRTGAPLWALGRVLAHEHPELRVRSIDLDPGGDAGGALHGLVRELGDADGPDELALRGPVRLLPALTPLAIGAPRPLALAADRAWLITGGLGGIGLRLAAWLVDRGARRLALLGRSRPGPDATAQIDALRGAGARVLVQTVDVAQPGALAEAVTAVEHELGPIAGVVHGAGALADGLFLDLDAASVDRVLAPKVLGADNLHALFSGARAPALEHFVLLSSTAATLGAPAQANYAVANAHLDALAAARRAAGLPGLALAWGPWAEVGMAAADPRRGARLAGRGMPSLAVADALAPLDFLLGPGAPACVSVVELDAARWCEAHPGVRRAARLRGLLAAAGVVEAAPPASEPLRDRLRRQDGAERRATLEQRLRELVAEVTRTPAARLSVDDTFTAIGVDSLMALELRDLVTQELEVDLPLAAFVDDGTIAAIADGVLAQLTLAQVLTGAGDGERLLL